MKRSAHLLVIFVFCLVARLEVHTWIKRDGRWYRMQPFIQFLNR